MTHKEFVSEVQKESGLDRQTCASLLAATARLLAEQATELETVCLDGLGQLVPTKHPEYEAEDPVTHAETLYPPRITYHFQSQVKL
jgi:nucleoid DNA-binding protein